MDAFFENVNRHRAEGRELGAGQDVENLILEFRPQSSEPMLAACLWSRGSAPSEPDLLSFAATTDDPPPEVAAAGHDRYVIPIKPEHVDAWLNPDPANSRRCTRSSTIVSGRTTSIAWRPEVSFPSFQGKPPMKYNRDQWTSSFEDAMVGLRPHMTGRVLTSIALMAWHKYGTTDVAPKTAASEWSKSMDKPA